MIVADTNLIAYLLLPGKFSHLSEKVLQKDSEWFAPLLWRSEFRNVLTLYMRSQGLQLAQARETMTKAERLLNHREYAIGSDAILQLVSTTNLSAYDAEFGALASEMNLKLITFDKKILSELPDIAQSPEQFI